MKNKVKVLIAVVALTAFGVLVSFLCLPLEWFRIRTGMKYGEVVEIVGEPKSDLRDLKGSCVWFSERLLATSHMVVGFDDENKVAWISKRFFVE